MNNKVMNGAGITMNLREIVHLGQFPLIIIITY